MLHVRPMERADDQGANAVHVIESWGSHLDWAGGSGKWSGN